MNRDLPIAGRDGHALGHAIQEGILDGIAVVQGKQRHKRKYVSLHWLIPIRSLMAAMPLVFAGSAITWLSWAKIARDCERLPRW